MPKIKTHTKGNPITPLPEKNRYIFTDLIPELKKLQKLKNEIETKERYAKLNKAKSEIKEHAKEIYNNLLSREELEGLTPKIKKQVFEFIESKLSAVYLEGITRIKKMTIQQEAKGLISEIKDHKEKAVVKKEIISKIKYYNDLTKRDRDKINEIINYNLALITNKPYLTLKQSAELQRTIFKSLTQIDLSRRK
jgi:hypothetical protein